MNNEVISYREMCNREEASLQRGMNYRLNSSYSVILMSQSDNAPYEDRVSEDGLNLVYQGHDVPKSATVPNPKAIDQQEFLPSGTLTQNGKFKRAALEAKEGHRTAERVKVYEKIKTGIWSFNGVFELVDCWEEVSNFRKVFKFELKLLDSSDTTLDKVDHELNESRVIPPAIKLAVWKRDGGRCVICSSGDNLHFDHIIPFSKGGTSSDEKNIQLLCMRHNIKKKDKIE